MNGLLIGLALLAAGFAAVGLWKWWRLSMAVEAGLRGANAATRSDPHRMAAYHRALRPAGAVVDDRTWEDLDMNHVLSKIDFTASTVGGMMLVDRLRSPAGPDRIAWSAQVEMLRDHPEIARRIRQSLAALDTEDATYLPDLFAAEPPPAVRARWIYPVLSFAMIPTLVATAYNPRALIAVVAIAFMNFVITLRFKERIQGILPGLRAVPKLVLAGAQLADIDAAAPAFAAEAAMLRRHVPRLRGLRRAARWLLFDPSEGNELVASVCEYLNMLFLLSVNAFAFGLEEVRSRRVAIQETFEALGALDVAQSVATVRDQWTTGSRPDRSLVGKQIEIADVWHPLLETAVANSITVSGGSILVTGSNMSGKTTFIRTLGVAAILADAIDTVPARVWRGPPMTVLTSITGGDSLLDGKSYYLAEVERIRVLLDAKADGRQHLFLLDEIFRGTNTTERVAAGKAVLSELDRGDDVVVVATHDLELLPMLAGRFAPFHFREEIDGDSLRFDYAIKSGPSSTRNAIALLGLMKYPDRVVQDAFESVTWIEARGQVAPTTNRDPATS